VALDAVPDPVDDGPSAEGRLQEAGRLAALEAALADLPDRQRQAVVLRHIEGLTNPEIATVMEIGVEAVESLTARGKRALAALLAGRRADLGYEDDEDAR
jgi:RNA polymerase sigma-70 factor (ECF subfamily)